MADQQTESVRLTEALAEALYEYSGHDLARYPWSKETANAVHKQRYRDQAGALADSTQLAAAVGRIVADHDAENGGCQVDWRWDEHGIVESHGCRCNLAVAR